MTNKNLNVIVDSRSLKSEFMPLQTEDYMELRNSQLYDYVVYWIENIKKNTVKVGTLNRLKTEAYAMKNYAIASMRICDIKLHHIQTYISQLVENGYAYTTIAKQRLIVTAPLRYAYQTELIDRDCTHGVIMPAKSMVGKQEKEVAALSPDEQVSFRNVVQRNPKITDAILEFVLETGLRIGEAQALTWNDVDTKNGILHVRSTVINSVDPVVQSTPKTRSSIRTIPMSKRAIEIIEAVGSLHKHKYVFSDSELPMKYDRIQKRFLHICSEVGIPNRGIHSLRHTFATNCYYKGCDIKILSKLLGHASTSITYNTYINLYGDGLEAMRAIIN